MRGIRRDAWDMSFHLVVAATFSVFHWGMCKAKTSWQTSWHNSNILVPLSFSPNSHNTVLAARDTRILRSASTLLRRSSMLRQGGTLAQHHLLVAAFHCG